MFSHQSHGFLYWSSWGNGKGGFSHRAVDTRAGFRADEPENVSIGQNADQGTVLYDWQTTKLAVRHLFPSRSQGILRADRNWVGRHSMSH